MKVLLFIPFLLGELLVIPQGEAGVTYCVKPTLNSTCFERNCQQCEILQHYLTKVSMTNINQQKNVSIIFLTGTHSGDCSTIDHIQQKPVQFTTQEIMMIGESQDVVIRCMKVEFYQNVDVHLERLVMVNWKLHVIPLFYPKLQILSVSVHLSYIELCGMIYAHAHTSVQNTSFNSTLLKIDGQIAGICTMIPALDYSHLMNTNGPSATNTSILLSGCTFHNGTLTFNTGSANVTMEDCKLVNFQVFVLSSITLFSGVSEFTASNQNSAILSFSSTIILSGSVCFINNTAPKGGAMSLYSSALKFTVGTNVSFINNYALETGGAIFIDPGLVRNLALMKQSLNSECFYELLDDNYGTSVSCNLKFVNNSARYGGSDIYGASIFSYKCSIGGCELDISGTSSVSSDPTRICLCDSNGEHQCTNSSYVFVKRKVYPGEVFTVSAVIVGGDFGPTVGTVHANFFPFSNLSVSTNLSVPSLREYSQLISSNKHCTKLNYSLHSTHTQYSVVMYLATTYTDIQNKGDEDCVQDDYCSRTTPVYFNIDLLPCGPGLTILGEPPGCDCYPVLTENGVECNIINGKSYFSWKDSLWMNIKGDGVIYNKYCPFNYCEESSKVLELQNEPDMQCNFNRAGRLCGACKENYSLGIGSSHCIQCSNNNNMALLTFFAAAGFLLVFFISTLNLTVTQGMFNGLIFYANIIWIYQSIFFPPREEANTVLVVLKIFIAWINLDFGIETCFVNGLTAFWKTWLQFVFPLYIWTIAGLIIVATRYSSRLTNFLGNRAVPVLDTLFLLSYMKLLRIVAATLEFSTLTEYPEGSTLVVWSVDGNLIYFGFPHVLLFLAGLATLLFLWLPYTLLLFLMQWLRRLSNLRLLKWIMRFHPVYDAYFAPLKHKHQYWFGVLLLIRGILLLTFASTFGVPDTINLLLLLFSGISLLFCMILIQPYKSVATLAVHSCFLTNLTLLSGFIFFAYTHSNGQRLQSVAVGLSTGLAFLQFCGIVLYIVIASRCSCPRRPPKDKEQSDNKTEPMVHVADSHSVSFRDSILEESQELLADEPFH